MIPWSALSLVNISRNKNNKSKQAQKLQLDWTSNTSRRKINLLTNQKGYDNFETNVGKFSARRIQICRDYFCLGIILKVILNTF